MKNVLWNYYVYPNLKKALKFAKKRLGTHERAKKKRAYLEEYLLTLAQKQQLKQAAQREQEEAATK